MAESIFEKVGRLLFPRERVRSLEKELLSAGIGIPGDAFAGYVILNVLIIAVFISVFLLVFEPTSTPITGFIAGFIDIPLPAIWAIFFVVLLVSLYFLAFILLSAYVVTRVENRRNQLELVLPDFLMLVSSNIKAGMTLDQAMWYASKAEFGLLSDEVKEVVKGSFSGESLDDALDELSLRFDSKVFERTILLIKQANATGGELTDVLERTAEDVRDTIIMRKEIAASLVMYEIFVLFAAVIGTPFLFAVAGKLIEVFEKIAIHLPASGVGGGSGITPFSAATFGGPMISSMDFFYFSLPTIFITCLISSFIVSVIRSGSRTEGMKYFPFVLIGAYLVYWAAAAFLSSIFITFS